MSENERYLEQKIDGIVDELKKLQDVINDCLLKAEKDSTLAKQRGKVVTFATGFYAGEIFAYGYINASVEDILLMIKRDYNDQEQGERE